jgi:glycine oxidase
MDIVVAGAGVIGLAIARELAGAGARVTVLERGRAGRGATWAAAGILSPTDPHEWGGGLGAFNAAAIAAWPRWQAELAEETGMDPGFERRGELRVGPPGERFVAATREGARIAGWPCEELDADALRAAEPGLNADGLEGVRLPDTAGVRTDALTAALLAACRARVVRLREGCEVTALDDGAVTLASGERVRFERVVLATGAWSSAWAGDLVRPPVRPVLGESVVLRADGICSVPVRSSRGSVVPRRDGTYHVGTTVREQGFQDAPSVASVRRVLDNATRLFPALDGALLVGARSGLRPMSADGLPVMGPVDGGAVLATGHGREGIIHAPETARLIAGGILRGEWDAIPPAFRPSAGRA